MLPPLATVSAMETRLGLAAGAITGADLARAEAALNDVSALVRAEAGLTWVADDGVTITAPAEVVTVVLQAALRSYRNPDGYTGESVGDYSYQFGQAHGSVDLYLSASERGIVAAAAAAATPGNVTGSIRVKSAYTSSETGTTDEQFWGLA